VCIAAIKLPYQQRISTLSQQPQDLYLTGRRLVGQSTEEFIVLDGHNVCMVHLDLGTVYNCPELVAFVLDMQGDFPEEMSDYDMRLVFHAVRAGTVKAPPETQAVLQKALDWLNLDISDEEGRCNEHTVLINSRRKY
jgi:hypothetical protein